MFSISIAVSMLHTDAPGLFLRSGAFTLCSVLTDAIDGQQVSREHATRLPVPTPNLPPGFVLPLLEGVEPRAPKH